MAASKKPRLSRGLDALLGAGRAADGASGVVDVEDVRQGEVLKELPVDLIQRGRYQPRTDMREDSLQELAASIKAQGVVQPIVVRKIAGSGEAERYEIIAGERRWRAGQMAGLHEIPAVIRDVPDQAVMAMALIENIQREDLNPLEEAFALHRLIDEFQLTHQETAEAVGRSRTAVSNLLRLLDLHSEVKKRLEERALEMGHARALLSLDKDMQPVAARKVIAKGLTVRATERLVRQMLKPDEDAPKTEAMDPDVRRLQERLSERLGARVNIKHADTGKGHVTIQYNSLDELDGIIDRFK